MKKYFYVCTDLRKDSWVNEPGQLRHGQEWSRFIGTEHWPYTRREARLRPENLILQFENKPPYKFIKVVR